MRLVTYRSNGAWRSGIELEDGRVADTEASAQRAGWTAAALAGAQSNRALTAMGRDALGALEQRAHDDGALEQAGAVHGGDSVELGPPVLDPEKIICLGLNYRDHAEESGLAPPSSPMFFAKYRNSLVGPRDRIVPPAAAEKVDYEAELAVVIGRR